MDYFSCAPRESCAPGAGGFFDSWTVQAVCPRAAALFVMGGGLCKRTTAGRVTPDRRCSWHIGPAGRGSHLRGGGPIGFNQPIERRDRDERPIPKPDYLERG
jgi:hypothetical protein